MQTGLYNVKAPRIGFQAFGVYRQVLGDRSRKVFRRRQRNVAPPLNSGPKIRRFLSRQREVALGEFVVDQKEARTSRLAQLIKPLKKGRNVVEIHICVNMTLFFVQR